MLKSLVIKNYALIKALEIAPSLHLNIVTGETGAGKSIMLGALGLLLGNRADVSALLNSEEKCVVEAEFEGVGEVVNSVLEAHDLVDGAACLVRREIAPSGKSRAFVNDTPVSLDVLKELAPYLIDVHSQHQTLLLGKSDFQLRLIDQYAHTAGLAKDYILVFQKYTKLKNALKSFEISLNSEAKELDYQRFLLQELEAVALQDADATLEEELQVLENVEDIKVRLSQIGQGFFQDEVGVQSQLSTIKGLFAQLTKFTPQYEDLEERFQSSMFELEDIVSEVASRNEDLEFDLAEITAKRERLNVLNKLFMKHSVHTVSELQAICNQLYESVSASEGGEERLLAMQQELDATYQELLQIGEQLRVKRLACVADLEAEVKANLVNLGMENAVLQVVFTPLQEPLAQGLDKIQFLFSANKGVKPEEIHKVASGGEFSRLMFVLKYILAKSSALPTLVFDEIDTGISGEVALKMGAMMQKMSADTQLLVITHLPQIASKGDHHFFVYKDHTSEKTISCMKVLNKEERLTEIAQMIGGVNPSEVALAGARELLGW